MGSVTNRSGWDKDTLGSIVPEPEQCILSVNSKVQSTFIAFSSTIARSMLPAEPSAGVHQSARGYRPTICRSHAAYATTTTTNASETATVPNGGCHLPPKGLNGPANPTVYRRRASKNSDNIAKKTTKS